MHKASCSEELPALIKDQTGNFAVKCIHKALRIESLKHVLNGSPVTKTSPVSLFDPTKKNNGCMFWPTTEDVVQAWAELGNIIPDRSDYVNIRNKGCSQDPSANSIK